MLELVGDSGDAGRKLGSEFIRTQTKPGIHFRKALILLTAKYPQYDDLPLVGNPVIKLLAERTVAWHA